MSSCLGNVDSFYKYDFDFSQEWFEISKNCNINYYDSYYYFNTDHHIRKFSIILCIF